MAIEGSETRFDGVSFVHNPLPGIDAANINLSSTFLDKKVSAPVFISSMTGGSEDGQRINADLAGAAAKLNIPLGLGSMRVLLYHPEVKDQFAVRDIAPDVPLFGNFSAVQLKEHPVSEILELCREFGLDGMAIHLNPGQEICQAEGDRDFSGLLKPIETLASNISVIVKETGFGIPPAAARQLLNAGARYIDVAGAGGTNWAKVEQFRDGRIDDAGGSGNRPLDDWGIPTAVNLAALSDSAFNGKILSSGGLRTSLDFAKSIAMGAVAAGTALPLIRAVTDAGMEGAVRYLSEIIEGIKQVMLLTGTADTEALRSVPLILSEELLSSARQLKNGGNWRKEIG